MRSVPGHMPRAKYSLWLNCNPTENVPIITAPRAPLVDDTRKLRERANVLARPPAPPRPETAGALCVPPPPCMENMDFSRTRVKRSDVKN